MCLKQKLNMYFVVHSFQFLKMLSACLCTCLALEQVNRFVFAAYLSGL